MTTIKEYTDAIEVVEEEIKEQVKDIPGVTRALKTIIDHLKANRWERVKQLAEQPENEK